MPQGSPTIWATLAVSCYFVDESNAADVTALPQ